MANGVATPAMAKVAIGVPPKGQFQRMSSISTMAATNATGRRRPSIGVISPANARKIEKMMTDAGQPAGVRSNIQSVVGVDHASPVSNDHRIRWRFSTPSMVRYQSAMPINPSGHHPHGGMEAASSRPAPIERTAGRCIRL